ncbi:MAG: hypothetical protein WCN98_12725, partial [Verrucomicrobiaceae bacterium]
TSRLSQLDVGVLDLTILVCFPRPYHHVDMVELKQKDLIKPRKCVPPIFTSSPLSPIAFHDFCD